MFSFSFSSFNRPRVLYKVWSWVYVGSLNRYLTAEPRALKLLFSDDTRTIQRTTNRAVVFFGKDHDDLLIRRNLGLVGCTNLLWSKLSNFVSVSENWTTDKSSTNWSALTSGFSIPMNGEKMLTNNIKLIRKIIYSFESSSAVAENGGVTDDWRNLMENQGIFMHLFLL